MTVCILITVPTILSILWEGQKPCRLHVRILPDTVIDCKEWVSSFTDDLQSDGKPGTVEILFDQAFTRDNPYHQVQEMEILATISSKRLDAAVCSEDLFQYLLELNACLPLEQGLSGELYQTLLDSSQLVYRRAGTSADEASVTNKRDETGRDRIGGYYAVDLSRSAFYAQYGPSVPESGGRPPLYLVILSNTEHLEDCAALVRALSGS